MTAAGRPKPLRQAPEGRPSVKDVVAPHGARAGYRPALLFAVAAVALVCAELVAQGSGVHALLAVAAVLTAALAADSRQRVRRQRTEQELAHLAFHDGLTG